MTQSRSPIVSYVVAVLLAIPGLARASGAFEFGLGSGASYLPMDSWTDFWDDLGQSTYSEDSYGWCAEAFASYELTRRHVVRLSVERLSADPSMHSTIVYTDTEGNPVGPTGDAFVEWSISAIPVVLTYEFRSTRHIAPFIGVGGGYFFSKVEGRIVSQLPDLGVQTFEATRRGEGYGVHVDVGVRIPAADNVALICTVRGRYSDGTEFTDEDGDIPVEFTGLNVIIGLGARTGGT